MANGPGQNGHHVTANSFRCSRRNRSAPRGRAQIAVLKILAQTRTIRAAPEASLSTVGEAPRRDLARCPEISGATARGLTAQRARATLPAVRGSRATDGPGIG